MKNLLHHLFLPKLTNNYRAKLLHHKVLLIFTLFFFSFGFFVYFARINFPSVLGTFADISINQLIDFTNQKRQENGLNNLSLDGRLSTAAQSKADDMFSKDYWAHYSPEGVAPWSFIKSAGYDYIYAGENLARGFNNAQDAVNAWMDSPSHRKNMLSTNYQNVGFAVSSGRLSGEETVLIVQMFGSTNLAPPVVASEQLEPVPVAALPEVSTQESESNSQDEVFGEEQQTQIAVLNSSPTTKPLINSQVLSATTARAAIALFIFVIALDMILIERRKILRFVGHNFDHLLFFIAIFIASLLLGRGLIL